MLEHCYVAVYSIQFNNPQCAQHTHVWYMFSWEFVTEVANSLICCGKNAKPTAEGEANESNRASILVYPTDRQHN